MLVIQYRLEIEYHLREMSKRALHTGIRIKPDPAHGCKDFTSNTTAGSNPKAALVRRYVLVTLKTLASPVASYYKEVASLQSLVWSVITIGKIGFMKKSELEGAITGDIALNYHVFTYVEIARSKHHSVQRIDSGAIEQSYSRLAHFRRGERRKHFVIFCSAVSSYT